MCESSVLKCRKHFHWKCAECNCYAKILRPACAECEAYCSELSGHVIGILSEACLAWRQNLTCSWSCQPIIHIHQRLGSCVRASFVSHYIHTTHGARRCNLWEWGVITFGNGGLVLWVSFWPTCQATWLSHCKSILSLQLWNPFAGTADAAIQD